MRLNRNRLAVAGLLSLTCAPAFAEQSPALDRFNLSVGAFRGDTDTDLRAQSRGVTPEVRGKLSFEDDLGFPKHNTIYRVKADGLITDHNGWAVDYYRLNRDRTIGYGAAIDAPGGDVSVSAQARGRMNLDLGTAAFQHWFGERQDVFGLGLGAAYYHVHLSAAVNGTASQVGGETVSGEASTSYNEGAWAPVLTLGYRHQFNDQWRLYANASGIKKNGGNLNGHIYNGALGVEYYPWKQLGFGAEYSISKVHLNRESRDYAAQLDIRTKGPGVYVHWRF